MKFIFNIKNFSIFILLSLSILIVKGEDPRKLRSLQQQFPSVLTNTGNNTCITVACGDGHCNQNSYCLNNMACLCSPGFVTVPLTNDFQCCYEQKKQISAFLLELFVGFGAGHFYVGRHDYAGAKIFIFLFMSLSIITLFILSKYLGKSDGLWKYLKWGILILTILFYLLWQTIDIIYYASNGYTDGNGVPLADW